MCIHLNLMIFTKIIKGFISIKRRYAQLVKNCRPEDDPAAWQQLHDAYEQALRYDDEDQWQEEEGDAANLLI